MSIGDNIRQARKTSGFTQEQLAAKSGVATVTIRQYEGGKRQPRIEQLTAIANALSVPLQSLTDPASYDVGFDEGSQAQRKQYEVHFGIYHAVGYSFSKDECRLIKAFSTLNESGKRRAIELLEDLRDTPKYTIVEALPNAINEKKSD